jgi:RNA polymerase sigma factor (sigma-70 family)
MGIGQGGTVLGQLRKLAALGGSDDLTDGQLLERFASRHEESAFAALVRRHGPMVLGVCRRVLSDEHDAEDAFQATFLVLLRRAAALDRRRPLANWLYTVAYHAALRARSTATRRRVPERQALDMTREEPDAAAAWRDLRPVLDEELSRLPETCREAFVLCYLEGKTNTEAARQLGWPAGTVKSRLARARELLRRRLTRRGVTLSAAGLTGLLTANATAALPPRLLNTMLQTALRFAAGKGAAAPATALAEGVLSTMFATKLKQATVVVVAVVLSGLGAGLLAHHALAQKQAVPTTQARPVQVLPAAPGPAARPEPPPAAKGQGQAVISGRVVDADDKPVADAQLAILGIWKPKRPRGAYRQEVLAQGKSDQKGQFRLKVGNASPDQFHWVHVLASAKGYGLGWQRVTWFGKIREAAVLHLPPEQVISGRLFDLQGLPAANVKGRVTLVFDGRNAAMDRLGVRMMAPPARPGGAGGFGGGMANSMRRQGGFSFTDQPPPKDLPLWPKPVTTDAQGRFEIRGFGRGQTIDLVIEDDHFATQKLTLETGTQAKPKPVSLALAPPQKVEGKVVAEDNGEPVAGASITIAAFRNYQGNAVVTHTDAQGRYHVNAYPGDPISVEVFPPEGAPFLGVRKQRAWPKGAVQQTVDVGLPRGILVRGKVVEQASNRPADQVSVYFAQVRDNDPNRRNDLIPSAYYPVYSQPDGSFRIVVLPGPGHLLCTAPGPDLVWQTTTAGELNAGKPGGDRRYFHAVVRLDLKPQKEPKDLTVTVRRGVTLRGKLVGPDGKPVPRAVLFGPGDLIPPQTNVFVPGQPSGGNISRIIALRDGTFELPGCDPDKVYRVFFLNVPRDFPLQSGGATYRPLAAGQAIRYIALDSGMGWAGGLLADGKDRLGAAADLSAKEAGGKPMTVKLSACGSAEVRLLDDKGKPVQNPVWLEMVVNPQERRAKNTVNPEVVAMHSPFGGGAEFAPGRLAAGGGRNNRPFGPDAQGRVKFPALIPGATYRIRVLEIPNLQVKAEKEFTAESGKTVKLPDIVVPRPKQP